MLVLQKEIKIAKKYLYSILGMVIAGSNVPGTMQQSGAVFIPHSLDKQSLSIV